jgi:hypothetical protein
MIRSRLKSLLKPDAYPEPTTRVELVQTHVSWIFLTDCFAYKIKKPVDFGFLNFSTIDRRRFYCNEEVKYNSRLCPGIYEGVVELRETPAGAAFRGAGQIIDYAVKMKRLPAEGMLDRLVENNAIAAADLAKVARVIADFHGTAATSPLISEYGRLDRILFNWQENFEQVQQFKDATLPDSERELIRSWVFAFAEQNGELFSRRLAEGFIRECDGDIHLENICLADGRVYIFDCIEFSERFRCCDTAADVAFLLMDLDFHNRHDLAEAVFATYLEASADQGMPAVIDFYKVYRAFVRGKVESLQLNDGGIEIQEKNRARTRAVRYFRLARGYIERSRLQPTLFITCGLMGSGKSTLAAQLAFELGIRLFSSDTLRKQMSGILPETPAAAAFGEGLYHPRISAEVYHELVRLAEAELSGGRSLIIDASFIQQQQRLACAELVQRHGARLVILNLFCSEAENRRRLIGRSATGRSISDGRAELLGSQRLIFEPPGQDEGLLIEINALAQPELSCSLIYERLA